MGSRRRGNDQGLVPVVRSLCQGKTGQDMGQNISVGRAGPPHGPSKKPIEPNQPGGPIEPAIVAGGARRPAKTCQIVTTFDPEEDLAGSRAQGS